MASDDVGEPRTARELYQAVRGRFFYADLTPGVLLNPSDLCREYGVSRTPMREVLSRLEHDGLVEQVPRGYRVIRRTAEQILNICETRLALESALVESAALRHNALDIARLGHLHEAIAERTAQADSPERIREVRELHQQWHEALREAGHNPTSTAMLSHLDAQLFLSDSEQQPGEPDPAEANARLKVIVAEHDLIFQAVIAGEPQAARDAATAHLMRGRDDRLAALARTEY